mgnify:CR=1 FL=1
MQLLNHRLKTTLHAVKLILIASATHLLVLRLFVDMFMEPEQELEESVFHQHLQLQSKFQLAQLDI